MPRNKKIDRLFSCRKFSAQNPAIGDRRWVSGGGWPRRRCRCVSCNGPLRHLRAGQRHGEGQRERDKMEESCPGPRPAPPGERDNKLEVRLETFASRPPTQQVEGDLNSADDNGRDHRRQKVHKRDNIPPAVARGELAAPRKGYRAEPVGPSQPGSSMRVGTTTFATLTRDSPPRLSTAQALCDCATPLYPRKCPWQ